MPRKLFCQLSPFAYRLSVLRCRAQRRLRDFFTFQRFATSKSEPLPFVIYTHNSLIRRRLGNVDMRLQENKAVNLALTVPKLNGVVIKPGQTFSFWRLVGNCTAEKGYREGLTISSGKAGSGIGGGMCQLTNLIHWAVLHSDLTITEHHHHDSIDLFPDYNRQIPFGTGTSIMYNYLDYRFKNTTDTAYQIIIGTTEEYLCMELRAQRPQKCKYHVFARNEFFSREGEQVYRNGEVWRRKVDCRTGNTLEEKLIKTNHALVCYDSSKLEIRQVK